MYSSRANFWAPKTQSPNGLRVTLVKNRSLKLDHGVVEQPTKETPVPNLNPVPRWTIESNNNPCKLVIKRRKMMESSPDGSLNARMPGEPSLKVRIVASKKARQDGEASFARIKNWCKEQVATSLPSTCYDSYFAADVTLQPSPKCVMSEALLSGELFHLQPSPKDSGIDVSSPPRRLDEMHLADTSCFSTAAAAAAAGPVTEVCQKFSGKLYRANVNRQKTLNAKQQNLEQMRKTVAESANVEFTNPPNNSLTSPGLLKHEPCSRTSPVVERNCLLMKFPTSAFQVQAELKCSNNKTTGKKLRNKIDGKQLSTVDNRSNSKSSPETASKHQGVQNNGLEGSSKKRHDLEISSEMESETYSVSLHKLKSKTVKRPSSEAARGSDLKVQDGLKEAKSAPISAEVDAEKTKSIASEKLDLAATVRKQRRGRNQIFPRIKTKIEILDENYSISGTDAPKNARHCVSNESKIADNKIKKECCTPVTGEQHVSSEETANEKTVGTICSRNVKNQISSAESESPSKVSDQTTDKKYSDNGGRVAAKMGIRINLKKKTSTLRDADITHVCSIVTGSVVESNVQNVAEKAVSIVSGSENCSEARSDLDRNPKTKSKLTPDTDLDKRITCKKKKKNQDGLSLDTKDQVIVDPTTAMDVCREIKSECKTVPLAAKAVTTSSAVPPLRPKRFTRSSLNKQLDGSISDVPVTHRDLDHTSLDDDGCSATERHLRSSITDFPKTEQILTDSILIDAGSVLKPSEMIESTETTLDALLSGKMPRNTCSTHVKKRRAGSRNSASRRSFERHFNSSTAARVKTEIEIGYNQECVSFAFDDADGNKNENKNNSLFSDCGIIKMEPPELCSFSLKGCEDELLPSAASKSCYDEEEKDGILANHRLGTSLSSPSVTKSCQEIPALNLDNLSWLNGEIAIDHDELFNPIVTLLEPSCPNSSAFSSSPDSNSKFNARAVNNYFDEFAKFVTVQHHGLRDTPLLSRPGSAAHSALASAEEIDLPSLDEEVHSNMPTESDKFLFSPSSLCEANSEPNANRDLLAAVRTSQLLTRDFSPVAPCSPSECVIPEVESSGHSSARTVERSATIDHNISANGSTVDHNISANGSTVDHNISADGSTVDHNISADGLTVDHNISANGSTVDHSISSDGSTVERCNGAGDAVPDDTLISDDFCTDSIVSIDQELKSLQVKVAELLRTVFPGVLPILQEPDFLALPRFLDQVLDAVLCDADNKTDPQKCHCDCLVTLCRSPLTCLEQFQNKVLKFLRRLVPSSSLEDIETKEIELLVEAVTLANSAELSGNSNCSLNTVRYGTSCIPYTHGDNITACTSNIESSQAVVIDDSAVRRHQ